MLTNSIDCPCRGCEEREVGCHGKCEAYAAYRVEVEDFNAKVRKEAVGVADEYTFLKVKKQAEIKRRKEKR